MKCKKVNKMVFVLNLLVLFLLFGVTTVFAADGDFSMTYRVVEGYKHKTYTFNKDVTKTVSVYAYYSFQEPRTFDTVWKDNRLSVTVKKKVKKFFGMVTRWEKVQNFDCTYSNDYFTLNQSIRLNAGEYGFEISRAREEAFWDKYGQPIVRITIKGNVTFR